MELIITPFSIVTDSSADLPKNIIDEHDIKVVPLSFFINDKKYFCDTELINSLNYYDMMRAGCVIKTSLVNEGQFIDVFEPILKSGKDIIYIAFSSGISGTYAAGVLASEHLKEKYKARKIIVVDSFSGSLGQGLLVHYAAFMKKLGKSFEEIINWLLINRLKVIHDFTVDDLAYLKRGGRVSSAVAFAGKLLNIKPMLKADNKGKIVMYDKIRGRKNALNKLVENLGAKAADLKKQIIGISHADCLEDAKYVINEIMERYKFSNIILNNLDPVMGAHAGPGLLALFFIGNSR